MPNQSRLLKRKVCDIAGCHKSAVIINERVGHIWCVNHYIEIVEEESRSLASTVNKLQDQINEEKLKAKLNQRSKAHYDF